MTDLECLLEGIEIIKKYDSINVFIGGQSDCVYFENLDNMSSEDIGKLRSLKSWGVEISEDGITARYL